MILPPPPSTLFPYTTLFRSSKRSNLVTRFDRHVLWRGRPRHREVLKADVLRGAIDVYDHVPELQFGMVGMSQHVVSIGCGPDRKSTRLNSSHRCISYAVFCLNDTPTAAIYTLSLHDALPIFKAIQPSDPI